jgi:electron-transferring-flavoprotein dehydrogenase
LHFPGGALVGCAAGFVNVAKIKGTHNAMKSGMFAAEAAFDVIQSSGEGPSPSSAVPADMSAYSTALKNSWVYSELHEVRNLRPSFNTSLGIFGGIAYSGVDSLLLKGRTPWTFRNNARITDAQHTERASNFKPIDYPPPSPPLSTDLLTALALTGTNHAEDEMVHLRVVGAEGGEESTSVRSEHVRRNVEEYAGLLGRACPAGVYEYVDDDEKKNVGGWGGKKLVINSQVRWVLVLQSKRSLTVLLQNCIHCKLCDIKVPTQDITWTVPEGGGGPKHSESQLLCYRIILT